MQFARETDTTMTATRYAWSFHEEVEWEEGFVEGEEVVEEVVVGVGPLHEGLKTGFLFQVIRIICIYSFQVNYTFNGS